MSPPSPTLQQTASSSSTVETPSTSAQSTDAETPPTVVAHDGSGDYSLTDNKMVSKRSANDYIFGKIIGEGSFSTVYLTKDIHTNRQYAIKAYEKLQIIKEKKTELVRREKEAMNLLNNSGSTLFTKLSCTFQDRGRLYFVMSHAMHSDMLPFINKTNSFSLECTKFYSGEILLALEHLNRMNIQHRDLKPENILIDENMHIKVTDFGCCKIINPSESQSLDRSSRDSRCSNSSKKRFTSFVGTAQYASPEVLSDQPTSFSSDLWAFGCIIYQMIAGYPPFRSRTEYLIFKKILNLTYTYPDGFPTGASNLVQKLLVLDPNERLGVRDAIPYTSIRSHLFYSGLEFDSLPFTKPPPILSCRLSDNNSHYEIPDYLEPGLGYKQLTRLLINDGLDGHSLKSTASSTSSTSDSAEG